MNLIAARLIVEQGPTPGKEYILPQTQTVIGRSRDCEIAISDPEISRQHARIIPSEAGFTIEDLGSTNGTYVNDQRITGPVTLNEGDRIDLGDAVRFRFSLASGDSPPAIDEAAHGAFGEPVGSEMVFQPFTKTGTELGASPRAGSSRRRWILGCGCGCLLLIFLCAAALFFLDAYEQGRLLWCGPLQPFFEALIPGFSPACALP